MTARRVNPPSPARPPGAYAQWLAAGAAGILAETAAVNLLAEHGAWLTQPAFTSRCIDIYRLIPAAAGTAAAIRWRTAITTLPRQPASTSEKAVLKIAHPSPPAPRSASATAWAASTPPRCTRSCMPSPTPTAAGPARN